MTTQPTQADYDESYYRNYCGGVPYERSEPHWAKFFDGIAKAISETLNPKSVFDAGCAKGFLVEALRKHDIEAFGRDFSEYAINDVPAALRQFCVVGSITDPIEDSYDLVTCIEVLEHMTPEDGQKAIGNLCRAAPVILFSSSPDEFSEPTHINVQPPRYWLELFAKHGFGPRGDYDPGYLCPWAMLLERRETAPEEHELVAYAKLVASRREMARRATEFHQLLRNSISPLEAEINRLSQSSKEAQEEIARLTDAHREAREEASRLADAHGEAAEEVARLTAIERSTIWRATKPMRWAFNSASGWRRIIKRGGKALRLAVSPGRARLLGKNRRDIAKIAPLIDADWYISTYPDVANFPGGAAAHFYHHGAAEGRDPNPYFSTEWYLAQRPDVADAGVLPLLHYIEHGAREGVSPSREFDPVWYRATNPDVASVGIEPLEHYLRFGRAEGRALKKGAPARRVVEARLRILKKPPAAEQLALFVTHAPGGKIKPHVPLYVEALSRENIAVTVIVATDLVEDVDVTSLQTSAAGLMVRSNEGFDFAAWAHAARIVDLSQTQLLILANDSVIGPLDSEAFSHVMERVRSAPAQLIGLTDNREIRPHLQSYFLAAKEAGVNALEDFLWRVVSYQTKREVIQAYEVPLTQKMQQLGIKTLALFPAQDGTNQTTVNWRSLLERGCPFVKLSALSSETDENWSDAIARGGYDPCIARETLAIVAGGEPKSVSNHVPSPSLISVKDDVSLAVPSSLAAFAPDQPGRIAIICHVFHVEQAVEILSIFSFVPFKADVFLTTDTDEKKRRLDVIFSRYSADVEIKIIKNQGRDISAKLLNWKDVYDKYDYCLHLHTKESSHHKALRDWRNYIFLTLVGSPEIVKTIFGAFAAAPDLGIIAPQHYEPVRRWINWGGNFEMAHALAKRMGVDLDKNAALDFPSGSMFWARCAALRPLLDLELELAEFDKEKGQIDGTLAHAIERLYFISSEAAGMRWLKIGRPSYFGSDARFQSATNPAELSAFLSAHGWRITDGRRLPSVDPVSVIDQTPPAVLADAQSRAFGDDEPISELRIMAGVVTYNNDSEQLARCLHSTAEVERLFVWDNGARSSLPSNLATSVTHDGSGDNLGFGAAHNKLMAMAFAAGADVYICLNPDGFLHPQAVTRLAKMMKSRDQAALVECIQFPVDHPKTVDPASFRTAWASGAALAISKRVYDTIGGFDDGFFMYCEDVDLSWRARAQGFEVLLCPNAYFVHEVTNRETSPQTLRMIAESGARLARKWGARPFERWALTQGPGAHAPTGDIESVPEAWRDVVDFDHGFSFSETRWS